MTDEIRPAVLEFAKLMEQKLRKNDHKGGWETCGVVWLFQRLVQEVEELRAALIDGKGIALEAADVANFAMMIADQAARQNGEDLLNPEEARAIHDS